MGNGHRVAIIKNKKPWNISCFKVLYGGQGWIRTTVPSREQIYSLSPLATRPPTHILFSKFAFDEIWTRGLSLTKGVRYPCATKACLASFASRPPRSATSHKTILNRFVRQSPCATKAQSSLKTIFHCQIKKPVIGIEPTTYGLQNRCSTVELYRQQNLYYRKQILLSIFIFYFIQYEFWLL